MMTLEIEALGLMKEPALKKYAEKERVSIELVREVRKLGRLTVVNFAAGGIATPADAAMMMQMGCDGVFVGSGIFKSSDPSRRAHAIVEAVLHYDDPAILARVSEGLGEAMPSLEIEGLEQKYAERGL